MNHRVLQRKLLQQKALLLLSVVQPRNEVVYQSGWNSSDQVLSGKYFGG